MSGEVLAPLEVVVTRPEEDDETTHFVCHCTNDMTSACGLNVADSRWVTRGDEDDCVICDLAWPPDSPVCPWGCDCAEECAP